MPLNAKVIFRRVLLSPQSYATRFGRASYRFSGLNFERRLIESTLEAAGGVQKRAAELLHIKPTTLNEMIKRHDIRPRRKRSGTGGDSHEPEDGDGTPATSHAN